MWYVEKDMNSKFLRWINYWFHFFSKFMNSRGKYKLNPPMRHYSRTANSFVTEKQIKGKGKRKSKKKPALVQCACLSKILMEFQSLIFYIPYASYSYGHIPAEEEIYTYLERQAGAAHRKLRPSTHALLGGRPIYYIWSFRTITFSFIVERNSKEGNMGCYIRWSQSSTLFNFALHHLKKKLIRTCQMFKVYTYHLLKVT